MIDVLGSRLGSALRGQEREEAASEEEGRVSGQ